MPYCCQKVGTDIVRMVLVGSASKMASFNSADKPLSRRFSIEKIFSSFFRQLGMTNSIGELELIVCPAHRKVKKTATANKLIDAISEL